MEETRYCERHKSDLPLIEFRQSLDKRDGKYHYHSTLCLKCYRKDYRERNLSKIKAYSNKYYLENKEEISKKSKKRHKKNYIPRKRKTAITKDVDSFNSLISDHNIIIDYG